MSIQLLEKQSDGDGHRDTSGGFLSRIRRYEATLDRLRNASPGPHLEEAELQPEIARLRDGLMHPHPPL